MKTFCLAALIALTPLAAQAASPADPVSRMMEVATARLEENGAAVDYFDDDRLMRDFSARFAAAYLEASKYPAYDDGSSNPFDYDVIANGQDGCPLKDVKVEPAGEKDGVTTVVAKFKLWTCVPAGEPNHDSVEEVRFDVVIEDGKPVIDDIHRTRDGKWDSLVAEMGEIVKAGQGQPQQQ